MRLIEIVPAKYRKPVYVVYALVGVALGALAQVFGGVDNVPEWHAIATNVYLYIGGAFGLTAAANTYSDHSGAAKYKVAKAPSAAEKDRLQTLADAEDDTTPPPEGYRPQH